MLDDVFGAVPRDELQNGAMFAELGAEGIELRRIREAGRNGPSLPVLVEQRERQTVYAGLQRNSATIAVISCCVAVRSQAASPITQMRICEWPTKDTMLSPSAVRSGDPA